ncbi:MAG: PRC-barrel domain-containing protein [Candidatus Altiarchaeota archaeon]
MHLLNELVGKRIIDGADNEIAVAEGLNITLPHFYVYLRAKGGELANIRGRLNEFIQVNEIDVIDEDIHLYKDLKALTHLIRSVDMESEEAYRVRELIGLDVISSDDMKIGTVSDIGLSKERRKLFFIVSGQRVEEIRGNPTERVKLDEVIKIRNYVKIGIPFSEYVYSIKKEPK